MTQMCLLLYKKSYLIQYCLPIKMTSLKPLLVKGSVRRRRIDQRGWVKGSKLSTAKWSDRQLNRRRWLRKRSRSRKRRRRLGQTRERRRKRIRHLQGHSTLQIMSNWCLWSCRWTSRIRGRWNKTRSSSSREGKASDRHQISPTWPHRRSSHGTPRRLVTTRLSIASITKRLKRSASKST